MAPATQQDPFDNIDEYNPRLWQLPDRVSGSSSERLSPSMHPSNDQLDQSNPVVQSAPFANIDEGDTSFWPLLDFELDSNSELLSPSMRPSNDQLESSNPAVQQTPSANIDGYNTSLCQLPGLESAWSSELLHSPTELTSPISNRKATPIKNSKKVWTTSEDEILVAALSQQPQPFSDWVSLVALLPGRTSKQIRDRSVNHLDPNLDHSVFSQDDFELIKKGVEQYGKRWTVISSKLFQSKRSENQIKNVFHTVGFRRYISSQYGNEVSQG